MSSLIDNEALGDWSGVKGTEYHIVYALWVLLRGGLSTVAFYQGNDLLAHPLPPPRPHEHDNGEPTIPLYSVGLNEDIWIQLKATSGTWSLRSFLPKQTEDDNLLKNFICNAYTSLQKGKSWKVELVTQGAVKRSEIETFVANPSDLQMNARLGEIVDRAAQHLERNSPNPTTVDKAQLRDLALDILSQLARTIPKNLDALKAEIELEIAYRCYDRERAGRIANALRGALLEDAAGGFGSARIYDLDWLSEKSGLPLKTSALFDRDPIAACSEAVKRAIPSAWRDNQYVHRQRLENALQQFLVAHETLFVLVGASGSGKSWTVADLTVRALDGRARLLIPGSALDHQRTLPALAARFVRPFASVADWSDDLLLRRLGAAAGSDGRGPLVVVIDDLLVPVGEVNVFMRDLATLVEQCREHNAKLILTCQQQTWELYRLGEAIPRQELFLFDEGFSFEQDLKRPRTAYSFLLGDLTADELSDVVRKRLPEDTAERAALLLRAPLFSSLRNPFLLGQYLEQHGAHLGEPNSNPAPVAVDELLDGRVERALVTAARSLSCSEDDLRPAFQSLVEALWPARSAGLEYSQAISSFRPHLGEQSGNFLVELRRAGLVTTEGFINFSEPPVADRCFARYLDNRLKEDESAHEELRPETDTGVVAALMWGVVANPIGLAEALLARDMRWRKAVTNGLAQCPPDDFRVLAMARVLMRSEPGHWIVTEAGDALGQLISRSDRAWKLVMEMYFGECSEARHHGEYTLGVAMEFIPRRVGAAIRLKLSRAAKFDDFFQSDRKKRERLLAGALDPLRLIKHKTAADIGRRLVERFGYLVGRDEQRLNYDFAEDVDIARGRIALYGEGNELDSIVADLSSDNHVARYRAATASRGLAIEQPERIKNALCAALRREDEYGYTINRLLLASYHLIAADPALLLNTLRNSSLIHWDEPRQSTGQVLGLLGDLASKYPEDVYRLLPRRLDAYPAEARAFLSEMLSYSWWRCAEQINEAAPHLAELCEPDLAGVPEEFIPFAMRGAAIAQLGSMCLRRESAEELTGEQFFYPHTDLRVAYVNTRKFIERRADFLISHPDYGRLQERLLRCVQEEERVQVQPINKLLVQSRFRSAVICIEMLAQFAAVSSDPLPLLNSMPHDWQALEMCSLLLEAGRKEQGLVEFTRRECEERGRGTTSFQALHGREVCLAQLSLLEDDPHTALQRHRELLGNDPVRYGGRAQGLARLIDANPEETLSLLDESVKGKDDVPTLYRLQEETGSWRAWLISRLYARMFDPHPISVGEAREWCEQVLTAVRALPESPQRREYETVYQAILLRLCGEAELVPDLLEPAASLIQQSHALALAILSQADGAINHGEAASWLKEALNDRRGWIDSIYVLEEASFKLASRTYRNYVFPAVRLASVAAGARYGLSDPAARLLSERKLVKELLDRHSNAFEEPDENDEGRDSYRCRLEEALTAFEQQLVLTPLDETLWAEYAGVLLRSDRLAEAETALRNCLALPSNNERVRASALYNMACVHARTGREDECRVSLEESARLRKLDRRHTAADPDLESVWGSEWFQALLGRETDEIQTE